MSRLTKTGFSMDMKIRGCQLSKVCYLASEGV